MDRNIVVPSDGREDLPLLHSKSSSCEDSSHILTGGNDRCATVFNKDTEQVVAVLKGHTKKVTKALYHPEEVCLF